MTIFDNIWIMKPLSFMTKKRTKKTHKPLIDYEKVREEVDYLNAVRPYRHRTERLAKVQTVFVDESGDPGLTEKTKSPVFCIAAVVTPEPEIVNGLGDSYPKRISSTRYGPRVYKYTTLREANYDELIKRMGEIADLPADFDVKAVKKRPYEIQSEHSKTYEVYRTLLQDLITDVIADHPGCFFDVHVDQNDFATEQEVVAECRKFPEVVNVTYYKNTPFSPKKPGGCRVADMVASSANEYYDEVRHNRSMEPYSIIRKKVVNKNVAREDPATAGTYNQATFNQCNAGFIILSSEIDDDTILMARVVIPSQKVDYTVQIA